MATPKPVPFKDHYLNQLPAEIIRKILKHVENPSPGATREFSHYMPRNPDVSVGHLKNLRAALPQLEQFIAPDLFNEVRLYYWHHYLDDMDCFKQLCQRPVSTHFRGLTLYPMVQTQERIKGRSRRRAAKFEPIPDSPPGLGLRETMSHITRFSYIHEDSALWMEGHIPTGHFNRHVRKLLWHMQALETLELRGEMQLKSMLTAPVVKDMPNLKRIFFRRVQASFNDWIEVLEPCLAQLQEVRLWECHVADTSPDQAPMLQALVEHGLRPQAVWISHEMGAGSSWFKWSESWLRNLLGSSGPLMLESTSISWVPYMDWKAEGYERGTWYIAPMNSCCPMPGCLCNIRYRKASFPHNLTFPRST